MPKGQDTPKCAVCRVKHLRCKRDSPTQPQCNYCRGQGVNHCSNELPIRKQRKLNQVSRSPTQQARNARFHQRHLIGSGSVSRHSDDNDLVEAVPQPNALDGSSSLNASGDYRGVAFESEKKLETCREWLRYHEYLCAIAKSLGKLELGSQKKSPGTKARSKVSDSLLTPIFMALKEIESSSDGAKQAEHFLLHLQLDIAQVRRGTPADESISLLDLEIAAFERRAHVVESLNTNATASKVEIQLARQVLKREALDLTKRRQECSSSQLSARASSANGSGYSTPNLVLPQVNASNPLEGDGSQFADIQHEVAEGSRYILTRHCPIRWEQICGGQPTFFFPLSFRALLCGSDHVAQSYMEFAPNLKSLRDWAGKTIVHIAAQAGRISLIDRVFLTTNRAGFDRKDSFGLTPVMIAALHGHLECLRLLIDANYTTHERDIQGRSLTSIAARHGHRDVVKYLLDYKLGSSNDQHGVGRCSPIYEAVEFGIESQDMSTCLLLLTRGADPYMPLPVTNKSAFDLANEESPDYLGLLLNWWQQSTPTCNNSDAYSPWGFTPDINQQVAGAGPSGDSSTVHPNSAMMAQAAYQTNQAMLQQFPAPACYFSPQDQPLNPNEQYPTRAPYPSLAATPRFQPDFT